MISGANKKILCDTNKPSRMTRAEVKCKKKLTVESILMKCRRKHHVYRFLGSSCKLVYVLFINKYLDTFIYHVIHIKTPRRVSCSHWHSICCTVNFWCDIKLSISYLFPSKNTFFDSNFSVFREGKHWEGTWILIHEVTAYHKWFQIIIFSHALIVLYLLYAQTLRFHNLWHPPHKDRWF